MPDSIKLDDRPIPVLQIPLVCPLCGNTLRCEFSKDLRAVVYEHRRMAVINGCPNEGRRFMMRGLAGFEVYEV